MRLLIIILAALPLGACATITRGSSNQVTVESNPPGATVRTSMQHSCPQTPCTFSVGRKDEFVVTASKPGYRESSVPVKTRLAGSGAAGFAGNVLAGGVIGMGVDAATGATLEHFPNPIVMNLEPIQSPAPAAPAQPGPRRNRGKQAAPVAVSEAAPAAPATIAAR